MGELSTLASPLGSYAEYLDYFVDSDVWYIGDSDSDDLCALPECFNLRKYDRRARKWYDYCCKEHALIHMASTSVCSLQGCTRPRKYDPRARKVYDFCSRRHAEMHKESMDGCNLQGCTKPKRYNPKADFLHAYCCKKHALIDKNDPSDHLNGLTVHDAVQVYMLDPKSKKCRTIVSKFQDTWVKGYCPDVDYMYVFEVVNTKQREKWSYFRDALSDSGSPAVVEKHYHGTTIKCDLASWGSLCRHYDCGICGISMEGFKRGCIGKSIGFQRFGHGFYLSPNSSKCHDYTQGSHTHRAMLLCDVLPGRKYVVTTDQTHLTRPPPGYDCVYGQPGGSLNYPEIVIYDEAAIMPRFVILYEHDGIDRIA